MLPARTTAPKGAVRAAVVEFRVEARFALSREGQAYAGKLAWRHSPSGDEMLVMNPFGQGLAELRRDASGARLVVPGRPVRQALDAETLLAETVGYPLPLASLVRWMTAGGAGDDVVERDAVGRVAARIDSGYRVEYAYPDDDPAALPSRLAVVRDGEVDLRLRIDTWQTGEDVR